MTITLTRITKSQWFKVVKVFFWLALSTGLAALTAWLAKNKSYLATLPAYNIVIYTLTQLFINEEHQSEGRLPVAVQDRVGPILAQVDSQFPPSDPPTPATPVVGPSPQA